MKNGFKVLPLEGLVNFKTGKLNSNAAKPNGMFPFFTCSQETFRTDTWSFDGEYVLLAGNNAAGIYPLKYFSGKFDAYQRTYAINSKDNDVLATRYVYYALRLQLELMKSISTGVATKFLTLSLLNRTQIPVPPLPVQRKIAAILSAYDDLIENNLRRIKILEEMAQNLYREWFVKFRFPGHQHTRFVDSPLGKIPEGWEVIPFGKILLSMTGGDWGSEEPQDRSTVEVTIIRGTDFSEVAYGGALRVPVRFITPSSLITRMLRESDVIIENSVNAKSRCIGTTLFVDKNVLSRVGHDAIAASFCKVFRFHDKRVAPLAHMHIRHLRKEHLMEYYQNVATNGIGNFQAQRFAEKEHIILPTDNTFVDKLSDGIGSILHMVSLLASKILNLRRTRDLLLPKLISGEVNVSELDIAVTEEVE